MNKIEKTRNEYLRVELTQDDIQSIHDKAEEIGKQCIAEGANSRFGDMIESNVIGESGNTAFATILNDNNVPHIKHESILPSRDSFDFMINKKLYDVKTRQMKPNEDISKINKDSSFLINQSQTIKPIDIYISAQLHSNQMYLYLIGAIYGNDIKKYNVIQKGKMPHPAYSIPIGDLISIEEIIFKETEIRIKDYTDIRQKDMMSPGMWS